MDEAPPVAPTVDRERDPTPVPYTDSPTDDPDPVLVCTSSLLYWLSLHKRHLVRHPEPSFLFSINGLPYSADTLDTYALTGLRFTPLLSQSQSQFPGHSACTGRVVQRFLYRP